VVGQVEDGNSPVCVAGVGLPPNRGKNKVGVIGNPPPEGVRIRGQVAGTPSPRSTSVRQPDPGHPAAPPAQVFRDTPPPLERIPRDELRVLADEATRFGPLVALEEGDAPESLFIDITGCERVHGGEPALLRSAAAWCRERVREWPARLAIAGTAGCAWGVTRGGAALTIVPPGGERVALEPLSVVVLRLESETVAVLDSLGIRSVRQLLALPRSSLPSRFGAQVIRRVDQALGELPEVLVPERAPPPLMAEWSDDPPLEDRSRLDERLREMLGPLVARLRDWSLGVELLRCELCERVPGQPSLTPASSVTHVLEIPLTRPTGSVRHLWRLLGLRLDRCRWRHPIRAIRLEVVARVARPLQSRLFGAGADQFRQGQLEGLLDRLTSRLGPERVVRGALTGEADPARAGVWLPAQGRKAGVTRAKPDEVTRFLRPAPRPLRLFAVPQPAAVLSVVPDGPPYRLQWRGRVSRIVAVEEPERIETGWWLALRDAAAPPDEGPELPGGSWLRREYRVVDTEGGERLWMFQDGDERWFVQGEFE
jgi:protein ImuB